MLVTRLIYTALLTSVLFNGWGCHYRVSFPLVIRDWLFPYPPLWSAVRLNQVPSPDSTEHSLMGHVVWRYSKSWSWRTGRAGMKPQRHMAAGAGCWFVSSWSCTRLAKIIRKYPVSQCPLNVLDYLKSGILKLSYSEFITHMRLYFMPGNMLWTCLHVTYTVAFGWTP
jgi:hypothetical protein